MVTAGRFAGARASTTLRTRRPPVRATGSCAIAGWAASANAARMLHARGPTRRWPSAHVRVSVTTSKLNRVPVPAEKPYSAIADSSNKSDIYGGPRLSSGPTDEDPKLLKARIYRRVEALGLTMTQVLVRAGISKSQLYDVMNGKKQPTWGWLKKLAAALQWDVNELTSEEVPKLPV